MQNTAPKTLILLQDTAAAKAGTSWPFHFDATQNEYYATVGYYPNTVTLTAQECQQRRDLFLVKEESVKYSSPRHTAEQEHAKAIKETPISAYGFRRKIQQLNRQLANSPEARI